MTDNRANLQNSQTKNFESEIICPTSQHSNGKAKYFPERKRAQKVYHPELLSERTI